MTTPKQPNTLGNASLGLGIASAALVFGIGICALTGAAQNWLQIAGTPLLVCVSAVPAPHSWGSWLFSWAW